MDMRYYTEKIWEFNKYYAQILAQIDQGVYNGPFSLNETGIMFMLHDKKGCTATAVRERLGLDRGYMSRMIQRLEEKDILYKESSSQDKRQQLLFLTQKGTHTLEHIMEKITQSISQKIEDLSKQELDRLVMAMETLRLMDKGASSFKENEVIIRPFRPGDIGYVAHLHGKLYHQDYHFGRMFEYYVMKGLTEFMVNANDGELWVAEVNGTMAGSIAVTKAEETVAQLRWFILDEHYQGLGVGTRLLETALEFCKINHFHHVFLWTVSVLEAARHLYRKYNFKCTQEVPNVEWGETKLVEERWELDLLNH
ncbi:putative HTH-type DNA-binding domain-containing acetyltransferase YbfA [Pullulanibacillus camelliae]|uniref:Putative HTH-type DNA-binding domain-containing acetyltransferase YbfA n=1 Tax=Pullulanibacillus camelliae TaxID=1707096 RepID=A0A8J2YG25_9BACL|nr:bifunctional helix-turn-helix transcriptional regulator/GNAT family N-acetyltransferase [Pullulanibacillus camelliae]GGE33118.1 putative HTH-type DNA-binding domain-containing acetyltransferase YbfA [Pullulanibacillus camelliae]